ncbi:MAG: XdhC family protein, partial [Herbaspirillum sp.]
APANVTLEVTDTPQAVIANAPPNSCFLVMTHSHPLDQDLTERILRRGDARWIGLIGSTSKRAQFERRLRRRGISEAQLAQIVCPIGIPDIPGKEPAVIAIGVAAQLLQVWRSDELAATTNNSLHAAR